MTRPGNATADRHGGTDRQLAAGNDVPIIRHGVVRAVGVVHPFSGELDAADIEGKFAGATLLEVELGDSFYRPSSVLALAHLAARGCNVHVRGGYFAPRLAAEVVALLDSRSRS